MFGVIFLGGGFVTFKNTQHFEQFKIGDMQSCMGAKRG